MEKRILSLIIVTVSIALHSFAQTEIVYPQFTKALKVQSKGVNIRQAPSTQSAKINNSPEVLLVIDETDEWYHACILKSGLTLSQPGYVSKKVCKVKELPALDANYVQNAWDGAELSLTTRQSGEYKGYSIISYYVYTTDMGRYWIFVGKNLGNVCVGTLCCYLEDSSDGTEYSLFSPGGGDKVKVPANRVNDKEGNPDWSKLTDGEINQIMLMGDVVLMVAGSMEHDFRDGESESGDGVVTYSFDKSDYQGPTYR